MKNKINYMWIMNTTSEFMEAYYDYNKACKKPWKTIKEYEERCKNIEIKSRYHDKQNEALWAVHLVTNIPYNVLFNAVRIERNYEKKHNYEKCLFCGDNEWEEREREKLFDCLMAKSPEDLKGIYSNEFCENAIRRIENKKYNKYHLYKY